MAVRPTHHDRLLPRPAEAGRRHAHDPVSVTRRAPFSANPAVGARGQQTHQRIVDAGLRVFGEDGYHQCSIERITKRAGCSRISFYQYFSSKEDLFHHLVDQVARQVTASIEALGLLTPDADGWHALRAWVGRYGEIYARYEPVFAAFAAAAERDEALAAVRAQAGERNVASIRSRLESTPTSPRELDAVIALLLECATRTFSIAGILRAPLPAAYTRDRVEDAVAHVVHRTLFGLRVEAVRRVRAAGRPPALAFGRGMWDALEHDALAASNITLKALTAAGRDVFVARGYHGTRIDDVVAAAGVSHGAFYRYFTNKAQFAHHLAVDAMQPLSAAVAELPAADGPASARAALRRWLRRYNTSHANEAAMIRVWVEATLQDAAVGAGSAPTVDWGRRRIVRFLRPRGDFGDVEVEALVMVALLDAFGTRPRSATTIDAAAAIIEHGLLGR